MILNQEYSHPNNCAQGPNVGNRFPMKYYGHAEWNEQMGYRG